MPTLVVHGLSHVEAHSRSLDRACALYGDLLGFSLVQRSDEVVELDAGTVSIRFLAARRVARRMSLRVQTPEVENAFAALLGWGCRPVQGPGHVGGLECAARVEDEDGHLLTLWRPLTEDEYAVPPSLPVAMAWAPDAEALLQALLRGVPALFRGLARRKVTRVAEELALGQGSVGREEVIRGFILASPRITRGRNRAPLIAQGIDPDCYEADWNAE